VRPKSQAKNQKEEQCSQALICCSSSIEAPSVVEGMQEEGSAPIASHQTAGMPPGASSSFPHHRQLPNPQASQADLPSTNPAGNLAISCGGDAAHHLFRYARGSNPQAHPASLRL
jgi:hypothetical protein